MRLEIHPELATLFHGIKNDDEGLEAQLLEVGKARDKIKVWDNGTGVFIVDGHRRYEICTKHSLGFEVERLDLPDIDAVKAWMVNEQLNRRNVSQLMASQIRVRYLERRKAEGSTQAQVAEELGCNARTLRKSKSLKKVMDALSDSVSQSMTELGATSKDYHEIANLTEDQQHEVLEQVREDGWKALHGEEEPKKKKGKLPGLTLLVSAEQQLGAAQRQLDAVLNQCPECEMLHKDIYHHVESILNTIEEWKKVVQ